MKYQSSCALYAPPLHPPMSKMSKHGGVASSAKGNNSKSDDSGKHKVVIYFSDAYNNICNKVNGVDDGNSDIDSHRLVSGVHSKASNKDFMAQLKTVLEEKSKFTNKFTDRSEGSDDKVVVTANKFKPSIPEKPSSSSFSNMLQINQSSSNTQKQQQQQQQHEINRKSSKLLPSFIESIDENNVIKLKIEQNFRKASELVSLISSLPKKSKKLKKVETSSIHELNFSHEGEMECIEEICTEDDENDDDDGMSEPGEGYFYDWSFVQEWRSR